jgi:hypothetical protein
MDRINEEGKISYMKKGVAKLPRQGKLFKMVHIKFVGKSESFYSYSSVKE